MEQYIDDFSKIMSEADKLFASPAIGASTRDYVRDVLFPLLRKEGFVLSKRQPPSAPAVDVFDVWQEFSEYVDEDIDALSRYAGRDVMIYESFRKAAEKLAASTTQSAVWVKGDYDQLYEQVGKGIRSVCYVDYKWTDGSICRDVCTIKPNNYLSLSSRGICYCSADQWPELSGKEAFIKMCEFANVEWLDETGSQRQAGPGWVKASKRLPKFLSTMPIKFEGRFHIATLYDEAKIGNEQKPCFYFSGEDHFDETFHLIEWLDESQSTPSKEDAVVILKWVFENRRGIIHSESAEQLYNLYQQNK
jgi:hypothetical protein